MKRIAPIFPVRDVPASLAHYARLGFATREYEHGGYGFAVRDGVEIRVSDNGRGIPELIRGQLFEPFVSHGKENGTGLGLTVVQKIVQDHGGDVTVEKTSAEGTVFRLLLPLAASSAPGQEGKPGRAPLARTEQSQSE